MAFGTFVYEGDLADSYKIRLDTDQQTLAGAVVGTTTAGFSVRANPSSKRVSGLNPRHILVSRVVSAGGPPATLSKKFFTRLAICTQAAFDAIAVGDNVSINSLNYTVETKVPEQRR